MTRLLVSRMTLYKHGVGYFERRGPVSGEQLALTFHESQMNDLLKSLTVIDQGAGQVLGIDYPTPQSREERLAGNSIRLRQGHSLRDLLASLRGRQVTLQLDHEERHEGRLLGIDELAEQPLASALVSLLVDDRQEALAFPLGRVQGVQLVDESAARDLQFFLDTAMAQDENRQVMVHLSPGEHDLLVSYVAPAPTWRVSYRLVAGPGADGDGDFLLLGWGIFDNQLEEDLEGIELTLIAGMPMSFIYDLYTPFTPERPEVAEEARVAPGPVAFEAPVQKRARMAAPPPAMAMMAAEAMPTDKRADLREAAMLSTTGEARGEQFQYRIGTPVTVGRGQSAMVPIIAADLPGKRELLYNSRQMPVHPVAALRLRNSSDLTLERGPVTVVDGDGYAGEAILPYTAAGAELYVPYAVELNVRVRESQRQRSELRSAQIADAYLIIEQWEIRQRDYLVTNKTAEAKTILIEHPRQTHYELFDSPAPAETTPTNWRFSLEIPPQQEAELRVQERQLVSLRETVGQQSYEQLSRYLQAGLLEQEVHDTLVALLRLLEQIQEVDDELQKVEQQRQELYATQEQIRQNLQALGTAGKEGALRNDYVERLARSEQELEALQAAAAAANERRAELEQGLEERLRTLLPESQDREAPPYER